MPSDKQTGNNQHNTVYSNVTIWIMPWELIDKYRYIVDNNRR